MRHKAGWWHTQCQWHLEYCCKRDIMLKACLNDAMRAFPKLRYCVCCRTRVQQQAIGKILAIGISLTCWLYTGAVYTAPEQHLLCHHLPTSDSSESDEDSVTAQVQLKPTQKLSLDDQPEWPVQEALSDTKANAMAPCLQKTIGCLWLSLSQSHQTVQHLSSHRH